MSDASPGSGSGETNSALTRSYGVAFSEVWDAVLSTVGSLRRWEVLEADSRQGSIRAATASPFGHRPLQATIRLSLDDLGQTRLEIRFAEQKPLLLPPAGPRRARRFLRRLDRALKLRTGG